MRASDGLDLSDDLELALRTAEAVDELTLPRFLARDFDVDWKHNETEVTEIDRAAERLVTDLVLRARPDHSVFGEEFGVTGTDASPWRWIVDPIDGTSGFVRGIPIWATLIALTHRDHGAVLGVASAPALARRWWGGAGLGAHTVAFGQERRIHVSSVESLGEAQVSVTHSAGWEELGLSSALLDFQQRARRSRGIGDFWQHLLVAEGAIDVAIDAVGVAPYDIAALQPIVEAAGGRLSDRHGAATYESDTAISSNGHLHEAALASIAG